MSQDEHIGPEFLCQTQAASICSGSLKSTLRR